MGSYVIELNPKQAAPPAAPVVEGVRIIRLVLELNLANGQLNVSGPTHDKMLCCHMIANALKTIMDQKISMLTVPAGHA